LRLLAAEDATSVDPFVLHGIATLAGLLNDDSDPDAARVLLTQRLATVGALLPATHYSVGELWLALAEVDAVIDPAQRREALDKARVAFSELPAGHAWLSRLDRAAQMAADD